MGVYVALEDVLFKYRIDWLVCSVNTYSLDVGINIGINN